MNKLIVEKGPLKLRKKTIKSVCVFCGSRSGSILEYEETALELGNLIAKENLTLVYGGGNAGLMGSLASSAEKGNCKILGVIPKHLMEREIGKTSLRNLKVTQTMHNRKNLMYNSSDAFLVLPGGVGTLDEFFEILTWAQLDLHKKPIILINVNNFWAPLINLLNHQIKSGFMEPNITLLFKTFKTPLEAINYLVCSSRQLSTEKIGIPIHIRHSANACQTLNGSNKIKMATKNCKVGLKYCKIPTVA